MGLSRVVVLYPRGTRTGGPEALHQLVDELRRFGLPAGLAPHGRTSALPRVDAYEVYDAPEIRPPRDTNDEVVIGPEIYIRDLMKYKRARVMCWWLSIDNSPLFRAERRWDDLRQRIGDPLRPGDALSALRLVRRNLGPWRRQLRGIEHLAQSQYAHEYLAKRLSLQSWMLSDYIQGDISAVPHPRVCSARRRPRIAFNPAKGVALTARVQRALEIGVDWDPLSGLSPDGVREHMAKADLYLDLGPHPGKDRLPREAAMAGTVTVVAERGAGAYEEDVPIPAAHKVQLQPDPVKNAIRVIDEVLRDPVQASRSQQRYRDEIAQQREIFRREVARLVEALKSGARIGTDSP